MPAGCAVAFLSNVVHGVKRSAFVSAAPSSQVFREMPHGRCVDLVAEERRGARNQEVFDDRDDARVVIEVVACFRAHAENEGEHNRDGCP